MNKDTNEPTNALSVKNAPFSLAIQTPSIQKLINNTLGDPKRAQRFIANISSVVATNPGLQECDSFTLINSALLGEALELPPSPQLGYFYMVPFEDRRNNRKVATFILGYKGYIQLAIRSGMYKDIDAFEVVEGEYLGRDKDTGRPRFNFLDNEKERRGKKVVGYAATLELVSGFKKVLYWDHDKMMDHADKYSSAFSAVSYELLKEGKIPQKDLYKYSSFWYKDFVGMALKTMLRQLISKWGIMSVELQSAFENDSSFTDESGRHYFDNESGDKVVANVKLEVEQNTGSTVAPDPSPTHQEEKKPNQEIKDPSNMQQSMKLDDQPNY